MARPPESQTVSKTRLMRCLSLDEVLALPRRVIATARASRPAERLLLCYTFRNKALTIQPMQPIKQLAHVLGRLASEGQTLFTLADLRATLPEHSVGAFRAVVMRAEREGLLRRVCRGLYRYPAAGSSDGLLLYHAAARLRAGAFNYISLESVLSDAGVISQIPMNHVTLMSSARTATLSCGEFGSIECVHTKKRPAELADQLVYDARCHLWRASVALALRDMTAARRNLDLVQQEVIGDTL